MKKNNTWRTIVIPPDEYLRERITTVPLNHKILSSWFSCHYCDAPFYTAYRDYPEKTKQEAIDLFYKYINEVKF